MERSLYPHGVEVTATDLQRTESTKKNQILSRYLDGSTAGVVTGCEVTPSVTNGAVEIAAGRAYAPNGEMILVPARAVQFMADATVGVLNLVCAVYTEEHQSPGAHETDGGTRARAATGSGRVEVFTQAQYDVLAESDDDDLLVAAKDRTCILAHVTANGAAAIPTSSITLPEVIERIHTVSTVSPLRGSEISALSNNTPLGTARLTLNNTVSPPTVSYRAPFDVSDGATSNVASAGIITLPSLDPSLTCTVHLDPDLFDKGFNGFTSFTISAMHEELVARHSARDKTHRDVKGNRVATADNPHGLALRDLAAWSWLPGSLRLGPWGGNLAVAANGNLIPGLVMDQAGVSATYTLIMEFGGDGPVPSAFNKTRVYRTNSYTMFITQNARIDSTGTWNRDTGSGTRSTAIELSANDGLRMFVHDAADSATWTTWTDFATFGGSTLLSSFVGALDADSARDVPRITLPYSTAAGATRTLVLDSGGLGLTPGTRLRVYRVNSTNGPVELTWNCSWDGTHWTKDAAPAEASKVHIHSGQWFIDYRNALSVDAWLDSAWDSRPWEFDGGTGANGLTLAAGPIEPKRLADGTGPIAKKCYQQSYAKANGQIEWATGTGTVSSDAFNLLSAVVATTVNPSDTLRVAYRTAMGSVTHVPQLTYRGTEVILLKVIDIQTTHVDIAGWNISTGYVNFGSTSGTALLTVHGPQ